MTPRIYKKGGILVPQMVYLTMEQWKWLERRKAKEHQFLSSIVREIVEKERRKWVMK